MTDEEHQKKVETWNRLEARSDEWRARGNQPAHHEEARLDPIEHKREMANAKEEVRYLLAGKLEDAQERICAAEVATRGRPISARRLADEIAAEAGSRKASMYAAAAHLGFGR